jgi:hypothetical protein
MAKQSKLSALMLVAAAALTAFSSATTALEEATAASSGSAEDNAALAELGQALDQLKADLDAANAAVTEEEAAVAEAEKPKGAAKSSTAVEPADPEDDPRYVPIFRDEDGDRIPRNSMLRVHTTFDGNLKALDGTLITSQPVTDLEGPSIRKGDWFTVQFAAGLIAVDGVKKIK